MVGWLLGISLGCVESVGRKEGIADGVIDRVGRFDGRSVLIDDQARIHE